MKKAIFLIGLVLFSGLAFAAINKDTVVFDKHLQEPATEKARISSVLINIVNENVVVIYQVGNIVEGEFVVAKEKSVTFSSEEGKTEFADLLSSMKIDINALITILGEKI